MKICENGVVRDMTAEEIAALEREQLEQRRQAMLAPPETKRVEISREDYDLLDVTDVNTIYTIIEEDGSVTVRKGED